METYLIVGVRVLPPPSEARALSSWAGLSPAGQAKRKIRSLEGDSLFEKTSELEITHRSDFFEMTYRPSLIWTTDDIGDDGIRWKWLWFGVVCQVAVSPQPEHSHIYTRGRDKGGESRVKDKGNGQGGSSGYFFVSLVVKL